MRIKMPAVRIAQADAENADSEQTQDLLTCGSCQKPFALSDIVRFIQHKVLTCNKENYAQCFTQGSGSGDQDSDDGRSHSITVSTRRPSISAPIMKTSASSSTSSSSSGANNSASGGRIQTPPLTSPAGVLVPADLLSDGAASSTPKRLLDNDNDGCTPKRRASSSPLAISLDDVKPSIKQERMDSSSSPEDVSSLGNPCKKSRTEVADAESNTTHSEPSNYVCSTCKQRVHSAWKLVQHVQNIHGVKIYIDSSPISHISTSNNTSSSSTSSTNHNLLNSSSGNLHDQRILHHHHQQQQHLSQHQRSQESSRSQQQNMSLSQQNRSDSSTCSINSSSSLTSNQPGGLRHHPLLPPPDLHAPFGVGNLLRMPLPGSLPPLGPVIPPAPLFARPDHHFRMEQLVTEQFRHHGLNLAAAAAAVAASASLPTQHLERNLSSQSVQRSVQQMNSRNNVDNLEPQLDFYSQRLRQLAGTTSPGAATGNSSSPSPRKHSPASYASPSPQQTTPITPLSATNNNNNNNNNNSSSTTVSSASSSIDQNIRSDSTTPPEKRSELSAAPSNLPAITTTPRSASTPPSKQQLNITGSSSDVQQIYPCEFCGKKFRFQSNLTVHRRAHTGDKPYKCNVCDHACAQSSKLKRHMKIHRTPEDRQSTTGSVESVDGDEGESNDEIAEDEEEIEEEEEDIEPEEDMEYEAEDLSVAPSKAASKSLMPSTGPAASLVGELMDKFGLSNIAQYSEAYKQALQESGGALRLTSKDRDNNNSSNSIQNSDKINGLPNALRIRDDFTKNILQPQVSAPSHPHNLFNPFENPRLKLEDTNWWLPSLHGVPRNDIFNELKALKNPASSSSSLLHTTPILKKESRRNDTCEYCGKVFKNCSNLTVHRRSHTGEKPYKCELCSYACAQSSKLTRHMKTHGRLGKDVYRCRFCEMPFSVPSTLEKHMRKCVVNQNKVSGGHHVSQLPMLSGDEDSSTSIHSAKIEPA